MVSEKVLTAVEYRKILSKVKDFAALKGTREELDAFNPVTKKAAADLLLSHTEEAYKLLYFYNFPGIFYCDAATEEVERASMGGALSIPEILRVTAILKSARLAKSALTEVLHEDVTLIPVIAQRLFTNKDFEEEISKKIISEDKLSDNASPKLSSLRKSIRDLNARIRERLNSYMRGGSNKYLQENVVTLRENRYVVPVKSEYRSFVKGFIHDQSSSGATVFIEPEQVMELNNELKRAMLEESEEVLKILRELSGEIASMSDAIKYNYQNLCELDGYFARAAYSFSFGCTKPVLNDRGVIDIKRGRHPLIKRESVVPVSVYLGENYNFLLITGPNTGGKTVTLKLVGVLTLMAMSGLYIPADEGSKISVFNDVFCDVGDEQSIEQSLSTFSSHLKNIIDVLNSADEKSLVLIDEIGAGTDPEEGASLALAIIERLLEKNCFGIITTHYSRLKEFAVENGKIENASMEFDASTLKPMYKLNIGIPGSSNAIDIAKTLGLDGEIVEKATKYLSTDKISFERVLKRAEDERRKSEELSGELEKLKSEKERELASIQAERDKIQKEREKIYATAKAETKRIVADKLVEAEEIIDELKDILKRAGLESKEVFKAGELKNRLKNSRYLAYEGNNAPIELVNAEKSQIKEGVKVYVKSLGAYAVVKRVNNNKDEIEVNIGNISSVVKLKDIYNPQTESKKEEVKIFRKTSQSEQAKTELNIVGKTTMEGIEEVTAFIDDAILHNLEEVKIIHGVGTGALLKAVREYLSKDKNVTEWRKGKYGEGENGVTIVRLK